MKIGNMTTTITVKVKLSLWSAIKLRIAGMKNIFDNAIEKAVEKVKEKRNG